MATRYFTLSISFNESERAWARAGEPDSSLKTQKRLISCTPATSLSTYLDALAMERKNTTSLKPQNHLLSCTPASNVPTWREIPHAHTHKHKHANTHTHKRKHKHTHKHCLLSRAWKDESTLVFLHDSHLSAKTNSDFSYTSRAY